MTSKEITVVRYSYDLLSKDWGPGDGVGEVSDYIKALHDELSPLGVSLHYVDELDTILKVTGYGDLLNTIRLRSPKDNIANLCLGHVIGQSANCDFLEDIRRGVLRVAFAPEMIEPEGANKVVCHNCGCGC